MKNIETQSSRGFQEPYIGMPVRGIRDYDCYRCPERDLERGPAREYIRPDCEMPGYAESSCDAVDVCRVGVAYVPCSVGAYMIRKGIITWDILQSWICHF